MDCSPPGSSVHGILQTRILEWVAFSFSRGSSPPRDQTPEKESLALQTDSLPSEPPGKPHCKYWSFFKRVKKKLFFFFPVAFSSLHPAHLCKMHLSKQSTFTLELCWKLCGGFLFPMHECKHYQAPPRGPRNLAPSYLLKLSPPPHSQPSPCWVPLLSSWTQFPWRPRSSLQPDGGVPMHGELGYSCEAPNVAIITPLNGFLCVTLSSLVKG